MYPQRSANCKLDVEGFMNPGDDISTGIEQLAELMAGRRVLALSGAGLSTESGIPDYRGPRSIQRPNRPIFYRDFVENPAARAR